MRIRSIATVVALIAVGACGGDDKPATGPGGTLSGTYTLQTVNGGGLPATVLQLGTYKAEILSGNITLNDNNTFTGVTTVRETTDGVADDPYTASCPGTYTRSGSTVTFTEPETDDCGGTYTATWSTGNTLNVNFGGGLTAVFKK